MIIGIFVNLFSVDNRINNKNTIKSSISKNSKYRKIGLKYLGDTLTEDLYFL